VDPKDPSKGTQRDHWQKSDSPDAREALTEPPFPEDVAYLYAWAKQLHGRSGVSMGGLLPVSHREIAAWSEVSGHVPNVVEYEALLLLDAVMANPERAKDPEPVAKPQRAWPTRTGG
jgi:hypothetical protein